MPKRTLFFFMHTGSLAFRLLSLIVLVAALLIAYLMWHISKKPLDLEFLRATIETALYDEETGNTVQIERVVLYWPDLEGPLLLGLRGASLYNAGGKKILSVEEAAMSFSRAALLVGRLLPKTIILKKPVLRVLRSADNQLDIGLGAGEQEEEVEDNKEILTRMLGYLARPGQEAAKNSIISRLEAFKIEHARLMIEDHKLGITWFLPDFNAGFFSTKSGLRAEFETKLPDVGGKKSLVALSLNYLWDQKKSILSAKMENLDTMIFAGKLPELEILREQNIVIDAHLDAGLDQDFKLEMLKFDLKSPRGEIFHQDLSEKPLEYNDLMASAIYDTLSQTLIIDNTNVTLGGVTFRAKADLKNEKSKISGPIKLEIYELAQSQIKPLWPKVLRGDNSENWIVKKMSGGSLHDVWLGLNVIGVHQENIGWDFKAENIKAGFSFKNMNMDYRAPLDPLTKADGSGMFDLDSDEMVIDLARGNLGKMSVEKAHVILDRVVEENAGGVTIDVALNGKLQDFMKFIAKEPIHANKDMKMDLDKVKGDAALNITVNFPTRAAIKLKDFHVGAHGTFSDFMLPDVVNHDLDLSGKKMDVKIKDGLFTMKGKAMVEERDVDLDYAEYLESEGKAFKSKIKASLLVDPNIRARLGIDLSAFVEGSILSDIEYTSKQDHTAIAQVKADITPAVFFIDPFDYEKPFGAKGKAAFTAHFKNGKIQNITDLTASGEDFTLGKSEISFIQKDKETFLSGGKLTAFTLGETKGKLDFDIDKNRAVTLRLDAPFLDVRPFLDSEEVKGTYEQLPMKISVTASKMRTADQEIVTAAQMYLDIDKQGKFNQLEMDAIAGASGVYLRYKPDESGKRTFILKTDDAGAALRSFQVYSNIRGGKMVIYGEPAGSAGDGGSASDRNLVGKAEITDFKAVKAPVLSKLLSIMSLPGLIEVMSSDGLAFTKLEANFKWVYKKKGSMLILSDGRTSGNSLGLTFDGTFDNEKRMVNFNGTIVPMSGINKIIGKIPLVGDILTGGSGGIFAATYSIKGESENPDIGVNPLSVLAPGILRRIVFEN